MNKEEIILYLEKKNCCGCGACVAVCPKKAISLKEDRYGFLYPIINIDLCIGCRKCVKICKFNEINYGGNDNLNVFVAALKDDELIKKSASGGVFAGLSKFILQRNGIVYGAAWDKDFSVKHIGITCLEQLELLQGSKYSQSNVYGCFKEIKAALELKKWVLFSGTPCQISALKSYLNKEYETLITIDIICHGVGNNKMLKQELSYQEQKYKQKIKSVTFRSKSRGWGTSGDLVLETKKIDYNRFSSWYYYYFLSNTIFRESCYNCRYAGENRQGDITIGDYWKIESAHPEIKLDLTKGVSCILVNSKKGQKFIEECKEEFILIKSTLEKIKKRNSQLVVACDKPKNRNVILELCANKDIDKLVEYWNKESKFERIVFKLKNLVPYKWKAILKRLGG